MDTQTAADRKVDVVPGTLEGAEEEHQKSPMFQKMKAKVKKIKKSINKKVRDHGGRQQEGNLDEGGEGDEGDEDDEEMVDPEIHGAPIHDSSAPRSREATTQNRSNAVGGPDESSDPHASVGTAQNLPNATEFPDESSDAHARVGTQDWPKAVGFADESSDARARVGTARDRPNAVGGPDERSDRPNAVGGPDESPDASARVGTAQDRPISVGGPDENSDVRARVGTAQDRPNHIGGHEGDGAVGLGLNTAELAKEPAAPKTSPTEAATAKEQNRAGEEFEVPPELSRSFEAMAVSNQAQDQPEDMEEDKLSKDKNSSYTVKISSAKDAAVSAASMVYGKVAVAGTAVMAKVKPEAGKDAGEHENTGKTEDKGVSMKDYLAEKLSPGEDDKALSAKITEAVQWKKDAVPVTQTPREVTESGEAGGGLGVVGKMRETVSSFLGSGGTSPKSAPATEYPTKVAEDTKDLHSGPTEIASQGEDEKALSAKIKDAETVTPPPREVTGSGEAGGGLGVVGKMRETVTSFLGGGGSSPKSEAVQKDGAPVSPPSQEVSGSDEAGGGMGVMGKIRGTVTSFLGGGGSSPKSAPATESPATEDTKDLHSRPTEAVGQEKDLE